VTNLQWNWGKVRTGQIIRFRYNYKMRTVLVLAPALELIRVDGSKTELLHGIQLEHDRHVELPIHELIKVINKSGLLGALVFEHNTQYYGVKIKDPEETYKKLKPLIKDKGIYKTFTLKKAKRSNVFIDDFQFPQAVKTKSGITD